MGIVTVPFTFEGRKRREQAERGLEQMRESVDTLLVIQNDKLREAYGNLSLKEAFAKADDVLTTAAKGIAEVVSITGEINVDMNDVQTVMKNSGAAIMGSGMAEGENRALKAVETALESPLLNDNDIAGAQFVLLNITYGNQEIMMDEISVITDYIQDAAGSTADVIWGYAIDEELGDKISVTVIATGFQSTSHLNNPDQEEDKVYKNLDEEIKPVNRKIDNPFASGAQGSYEEETEEEPFLKMKEEPKPEVQRTPTPAPTPNPAPVYKAAPVQPEEEQFVEQEPIEEPQAIEQPKPAVKKTYIMLDDDVEEEQTTNSYETEEEHSETVENEYHDEPIINKKEDATKAQINLFTPEKRSGINEQQVIESRIKKIKDMTVKMRTPGGLAELEKEPAYVRAKFKFKQVNNEDNESSRMSVDQDAYLNADNSYLHDNVD